MLLIRCFTVNVYMLRKRQKGILTQTRRCRIGYLNDARLIGEFSRGLHAPQPAVR